jgi:hypothetical protein
MIWLTHRIPDFVAIILLESESRKPMRKEKSRQRDGIGPIGGTALTPN